MRHNHIEGVKVRAKFTEENGQRYRHRLEITRKDFSATSKTACVIMQNPSYANEEVADKSVQFMEKVVFEKGLSEFKDVCRLIVVNQFARIQTHAFEGLPHEVGAKNNSAIRAAFKESEIIIVAWGCANPFEDRKTFVLGLLKKMKGKRLFKTKKHPSRGCYTGFILPF